ncbi:ATP-binding cassette domain-containing protein [Wenzhouxiangella sp. AB-CW3]|uniref:ABC transporter ATP-binding protein n=1 Tax=Wenzhouxiangella sp. AB-CW3 TaxID=2771012 RepID=UPI00168BD1B4|nr:ATP-binding cassette domain-containing protein [Wenzhouxiangella sp. AB-CW3]QOC23567.1 ATP-binding cassette domain-containing protein [Wenzhouxiangella sp. AB-CW3]
MKHSTREILSCQHVGFAVDAPGGRLVILDDITLSLNAGETMAIVGASGSGKTTLLGLLAGLELPSSGHIRLADADLGALDEDQRATLRRRQVGFVFQSFHLLPSLTALENVMLALEIAGFDRVRDRAVEALTQVGLEHRMAHYPRQMSGGEQQRVAIARAFAGNPDILFADEPTGNLDRRTGQSIADLLFELNRDHGTALILVTHDLELARRCGHIEEIVDGRLLESPVESERA